MLRWISRHRRGISRIRCKSLTRIYLQNFLYETLKGLVMVLIRWDNRLELGNTEIDGQKKALVDALNILHSAMLKGEGRSEVGSTLKVFLDYAARHFAMEEKMMDSHAYPGLSSHKKLHDDFRTGFAKIINDFMWESSALTIAVLVSLEEWVSIHFKNEDIEFANFIKNLRS